MKVLSLFDGISCAMVALERAGFKVEKCRICDKWHTRCVCGKK